jgi:hypothetical protein
MSSTLQDEQARDRVFTAVSKASEMFGDSDLSLFEVMSVLTVLFATVVKAGDMDIDETVATLRTMLHKMEAVDAIAIKAGLQ